MGTPGLCAAAKAICGSSHLSALFLEGVKTHLATASVAWGWQQHSSYGAVVGIAGALVQGAAGGRCSLGVQGPVNVSVFEEMVIL